MPGLTVAAPSENAGGLMPKTLKTVCALTGGGFVLYTSANGRLRPIAAPAGYTPNVMSYATEGEAHRAGRRLLLRYPSKKFVVHDCRKKATDPVYP
jgi:hypothetical protein